MEVADLIKILRLAKKTVATAESCTGGLVAKEITDVPGASEVFHYGVVSYSNDAKMKLLGVNSDTLKKHTAVSRATALEMARGVRELSGANIGVATTGYAGGGVDSESDPDNGLVFIAVSSDSGYERVEKIHLPACSRETVRNIAKAQALELIIEGAVARV